MMLDLATVIRATGARVLQRTQSGELRENQLLPEDLQRELGETAIDSRLVTNRGLFVALRGERVDGHDFLPQAFANGARAALVSTSLDAEAAKHALGSAHGPAYLLQVPDPLTALQDLARAWRLAHEAEIIGITGSIGKTTTKEIVASTLGAFMPVLKSEANLNTEIGLPLMLLKLTPEHRAAVLEMGMYVPGDIRTLAQIALPRIGVVTAVAPVHLERVGSIERIARGKSELVASLPADGLAILNGDDPWVRAMAVSSGPARPLLYGSSDDCQYRVTSIETHGLAGVTFTLTAEGRSLTVRTHVPGTHTVGSFLAAAAVARALDVPWDGIVDALSQVRLDVRQRIIRDSSGTLIIDDSYNAAPPSVRAALELLRAAPGEKIAVLGDMLELGPDEEREHREIGECAAEVADWLIVRGPRSRWIAEGARAAGLPRDHVLVAGSNEDAAARVRAITGAESDPSRMRRQETRETDVRYSVLVKASRGVSLDEVVRRLVGEPA